MKKENLEQKTERKINKLIEEGAFEENEFQEYELLISEGC